MNMVKKKRVSLSTMGWRQGQFLVLIFIGLGYHNKGACIPTTGCEIEVENTASDFVYLLRLLMSLIGSSDEYGLEIQLQGHILV